MTQTNLNQHRGLPWEAGGAPERRSVSGCRWRWCSPLRLPWSGQTPPSPGPSPQSSFSHTLGGKTTISLEHPSFHLASYKSNTCCFSMVIVFSKVVSKNHSINDQMAHIIQNDQKFNTLCVPTMHGPTV